MKAKEINQYLEKYLLAFFEQHGFVLSEVNEFGYEISKEIDHVLYKCTCTKLENSKGIYFEAFGVSISFEEIENLLKELSLKYELEQSSYTLRNYDNEKEARENRLWVRAVVITSEPDFAQYGEAVKQYCNDVVFPFFDKYNSTESLNEFIKEMPEDELTYHIGGEF